MTLMDYPTAVKYLFDQFPNYQLSGGKALHFGLDKIGEICTWLGNPQSDFASIHIAGTNGKGSSAAMLSACLTSAGYRTGLFTSPHILDFGERIRIDGSVISEGEVADFAERFQNSGIEGATFLKSRPLWLLITLLGLRLISL